MKVITSDYTFATVTPAGFEFGSSESCTSIDGNGLYVDLADMKIDLSGTGFTLNESVS